MDFSALVLSVEVARRDARSALPHAPVRRPAPRWWWARAAVHRVNGREAPDRR